jgi:hypothetical protein
MTEKQLREKYSRNSQLQDPTVSFPVFHLHKVRNPNTASNVIDCQVNAQAVQAKLCLGCVVVTTRSAQAQIQQHGTWKLYIALLSNFQRAPLLNLLASALAICQN